MVSSKLEPNSFILLSSFLFFVIFVTSTKAQLETSQSHYQMKVKTGMTHIHFFLHDIVSGKNPTVMPIAQPVSGSATSFGMMIMMDDKLSEGPDLSSKEECQAQGLYASSCLNEICYMQVIRRCQGLIT